MALDEERQHGRPAVQPKEATRLPGAPQDARTIIARLKRPASDPRSYQGYATFEGASGRIPRYYVYIDQFDRKQAQAPGRKRSSDDTDSPLRAAALQAQLRAAETTNTELLAANADLRIRLAGAETQNQQLRADLSRAEAGRARDQEAIRILAATNALMAEAARTIQQSADGFQQAGERALTGARQYLEVTQLQGDVLAQYITPDDLSDLGGSADL